MAKKNPIGKGIFFGHFQLDIIYRLNSLWQCLPLSFFKKQETTIYKGYIIGINISMSNARKNILQIDIFPISNFAIIEEIISVVERSSSTLPKIWSIVFRQWWLARVHNPFKCLQFAHLTLFIWAMSHDDPIRFDSTQCRQE